MPTLNLLCTNRVAGTEMSVRCLPYLATLPRRSPRPWMYLWSRLWTAKLVSTAAPSLVLICLSKTCEQKAINALLFILLCVLFACLFVFGLLVCLFFTFQNKVQSTIYGSKSKSLIFFPGESNCIFFSKIYISINNTSFFSPLKMCFIRRSLAHENFRNAKTS